MQTTTHAERTYHANCAANARAERLNAEAVNDILTARQAYALVEALNAMPEASVMLVETVFEQYGWPPGSVDTAWLDDTGRVVWALYLIYRGEVVA